MYSSRRACPIKSPWRYPQVAHLLNFLFIQLRKSAHARCSHSNIFQPRFCRTIRKLVIFMHNLICLRKANTCSSFSATRSWLPDHGYQILAFISWLSDPGYKILATRFWLPDPGYQVLATRSCLPDPAYQILAIRSWLPRPMLWTYVAVGTPFWGWKSSI